MKTLPIPVMDAAAQHDLVIAHALLENPGVAAQLANALGAPIESLITRRLPKMITRSIDGATRGVLQVAMKSALLSLRGKADTQRPASTARHTMVAAVTGGAGGFFGLPGLMVELPVTTTVMLRSIADIARSEGESLQNPETALACLEVLAHGGRSISDDGAESGYFAVRAAMAQQLSAAAHYVAAHGFASKGAPALVSLVSRVAAKFSVNVGEKLAVQAVPLVGAVSGAALNTLFMRHFQSMARGHFIVRRLERRFGEEAVQRAYAALPASS